MPRNTGATARKPSAKGQAAPSSVELSHAHTVAPSAYKRPKVSHRPVAATIWKIEAAVETLVYLRDAASWMNESARIACAAAEIIDAALEAPVVDLVAIKRAKAVLVKRARLDAERAYQFATNAMREVQDCYRQAEEADAARKAVPA